VNQFYNKTVDQNETLSELRSTLEGFQSENDRLEQFNSKLLNGLDYLNTTLSEGIDTSLEEITVVLGERVQQQQLLTLKQLEISYRQLIQNWDCGYRDVFSNEPYGQNFDIPMIGYDPNSDRLLLPESVTRYINDRVLSKLCLSTSNYNTDDDFLMYLQRTNTDPRGITSNQLIRSVALYTDEALKHYFPTSSSSSSSISTIVDDTLPANSIEIGKRNEDSNNNNNNNEDDGAGGITIDDWINAGFRCELIPQPFRWTEGGSGASAAFAAAAAARTGSGGDDDDGSSGMNLIRGSNTYTLNPASP